MVRPRHPLRVLLTEDGLVNQQVAVGLLELAGHAVVVAGTGKESLDTLDKQPFDVVLMDVQMPEMDGLEATAAIRAREKTTGGRIPIIAMTAHAMKGDREICLAAGMDGYLSKPILAEALYAALEQVVPAGGALASAPVRAAESDGESDVLDWGMALDRVRGRREFLIKMIELFFTECARLVPELRSAIDRADGPGVRRACAHAPRIRGLLRRAPRRGGRPAPGADGTRQSLGRHRRGVDRPATRTHPPHAGAGSASRE